MTGTAKPAQPGAFVAFVAHAMLLRYLGQLQVAHQHAKTCGIDVSAYPEPPKHQDIAERYSRLMGKWATEEPRSPGGVLAYVDLVMEILRSETNGGGFLGYSGPVLTERDLGNAMLLLASCRRWLNEQDIDEAVQQERAAHAQA